MTSDEHESPPPLSDAERRWLKRLRRVFKDMPGRLLIVEGGDSLTLVDRAAARDHELCDGGSGDAKVWLADIPEGLLRVMGVSA